jgi:hypothetical protein
MLSPEGGGVPAFFDDALRNPLIIFNKDLFCSLPSNERYFLISASKALAAINNVCTNLMEYRGKWSLTKLKIWVYLCSY